MNKNVFLILVLLALGFLYSRVKKSDPQIPRTSENASSPSSPMKLSDVEPAAPTMSPEPAAVAPAQAPVTSKPVASAVYSRKEGSADPKSRKRILPYVLEDGLIVVQGDLVVGRPLNNETEETGYVEAPTLHLWPGPVIPFAVDPELNHPERVQQALALFEGTVIRFVPVTNQKDAIVFTNGTGTCKSFVGKVGGAQPIFLPADCGPKEIAHEVMHALGFVHEQNRSDRDQYIQVNYENIDEKYKDNFEMLPDDFMKASGAGRFDFESLMIYPAWMFAKNGRSTMQPKVRDQQILPGSSLSAIDVERLARVYGVN